MADQFSERTQGMINEFGENRFPSTFKDWKGIGDVSQKALKAQGITEPVQLLGHFLMLKMNADTFEAFLEKAGVASAYKRSVRAQLQEWCQIHDVRLGESDLPEIASLTVTDADEK